MKTEKKEWDGKLVKERERKRETLILDTNSELDLYCWDAPYKWLSSDY